MPSANNLACERTNPLMPVVHVLVGKPGTGKTTWVDKEAKMECCGFDRRMMRNLVERGTPLGSIAISTTCKEHQSADSYTMITMACDFIRGALEGVHESEFGVSMVRFQTE